MAVHVGYDPETDTRLYTVSGQVFFASAEIFADRFDLRDTARRARIDLTNAHLWDITAVGALEDVAATMRLHGMSVEVVGLNEASAILVDRHAPLMRDAGV
jgi:SulP family sulfate permease